MGQADILKILEKTPGEAYRALEIASKLGLNVTTVGNSLRRLHKVKEIEVEYRRIRHHTVGFYYVKQ